LSNIIHNVSIIDVACVGRKAYIVCNAYIRNMQVKVINGSEHVFSIEEAARRLGGLGMRVGQLPEALSIPYEVEFPFSVGAGNSDYVVEVKGSYNAILALQRMVN
jgi:hypothetical protein